MRLRCPDTPIPNAAVDIIGCGFEFDAAVDFEGLVDCPACGMFFTPADEPETVLVPAHRPSHPKDCYPCKGTGRVVGFGADGAPCPADHVTEG